VGIGKAVKSVAAVAAGAAGAGRPVTGDVDSRDAFLAVTKSVRVAMSVPLMALFFIFCDICLRAACPGAAGQIGDPV
jgi:uncharacterized membrane protein YadS